MPTLILIDRDGTERRLEGATGLSVMEIVRDNGADQLLALCGGCCSCATCHVYVDPAFMGLIDPSTRDEDDLLDGSDHRTPGSRLSCQIMFEARLDGLRVTIAPED